MSALLYEEPLPPPAWFNGRSQGGSGAVMWRYPLHLLAPGQAIFIANHGPLAKAALRALLAYRALHPRTIGAFTMRRAWVCGIQGVIIRRNPTGH